jgi:organic hydroperoxide reductase OsmC/OhrA
VWSFDGGQSVPASASPHIVPLPYSAAENIDPEEAFVASLSSCHMLFFLSLAARRGFVVDEYKDEALGIIGKDTNGRTAMIRVLLRPNARYSGSRMPTREQVKKLHHRSHELCFIANSVKTEVLTEIVA